MSAGTQSACEIRFAGRSQGDDLAGLILPLPLFDGRPSSGAPLQPNMDRKRHGKTGAEANVNLPISNFVIWRLLHVRRQVALHIVHPSLKTERFGTSEKTGKNCKPLSAFTKTIIDERLSAR